MKKKLSEIIKDIEKLEPKNIIDYIFRGSGLNQYVKKTGKKKKPKKYLIGKGELPY